MKLCEGHIVVGRRSDAMIVITITADETTSVTVLEAAGAKWLAEQIMYTIGERWEEPKST